MGSKYTEVNVTAEQIEKALEKDSAKCMVATSIAATVKGATRVEVDTQTIRFTLDGERRVYLTPYQVQDYVVAFDAGDEVLPFTFRLWEERRVIMRRARTTEAGKKADAARSTVRRREQKLKKLTEATKDPALPGVDRKVARSEKEKVAAELTEARKIKEQVAAAVADEPKTKQVGDRRQPKRAYKTRERHYGQRVMRVNQPKN